MSKYLQHTIKIKCGCLEWTRCFNTDGYPRAGTKENSNIKVHREVFYDTYGYYPQVVRHKCDNKRCINPDHLIGGNHIDNVNDRVERKRTYHHRSEELKILAKKLKQQGLSYKEIMEKLNLTKLKQVEYLLRYMRK